MFSGLEGACLVDWRGHVQWIGGGIFSGLEGAYSVDWRGHVVKGASSIIVEFSGWA